MRRGICRRPFKIDDISTFFNATSSNDRSVGPWAIRKGNTDFRMSSFGWEVGWKIWRTIEKFSNRRSLIWDNEMRWISSSGILKDRVVKLAPNTDQPAFITLNFVEWKKGSSKL